MMIEVVAHHVRERDAQLEFVRHAQDPPSEHARKVAVLGV